MKKRRSLLVGILSVALLAGCGSDSSKDKTYFHYDSKDFEPILGEKVNNETYNYEGIKVNPVMNLRDDFAMGVDGSMIATVEENGGTYFNKDGVEQDVYQIMANNGVNFFRVRLWNNPMTLVGDGYGGGNVNTRKAIAMSKRAQAAGMNIMVDFHYSDFWADPDTQRAPTTWAAMNEAQVVEEVEKFTFETLTQFKNSGVNVSAIQVGNEINNGMIYPFGRIDWSNPKKGFDSVANFLKAGIKGAKAVNKDIYTVIHLANGGAKEEFDVYFSELENRNVDYDMIGVSYYPYYHGTLEALEGNLHNLANKFNKPIMIVEFAYGHTTANHEWAANIYNQNMEESGKYLTSIQGQATALVDVINILANVPNNLGLGLFYWEPAWLPVEGASWATANGQAWSEFGDGMNPSYVSRFSDGKATWSNQGLFSYDGRALPSLQTFNLVRGDQEVVEEKYIKVYEDEISLTLNLAENEQLPTTYSAITDFDAIRQAAVVWNDSEAARLDTIGEYTVTGSVNDEFSVTANVNVIQNFIKDPGYESQGETDELLAPWIIRSSTPSDDVVKLNRKPQDVRSGTSDLNWYHGSESFSFDVYQIIDNLGEGTYNLTTYIMAVSPGELAHSNLEVYFKVNDEEHTVQMKDLVIGWGTPANYYIEAKIENVYVSSNANVEIGIRGSAVAGAWGHVDDWSLVEV